MAALNATFLIVTVSLVFQIVVLFLLLYGYTFYRRLKFRKHGIMMALAVFVHLATVFAVMVPSFVLAVFPHYILLHPLELTSIFSLIHEVTGALALGLGVWFVVSWRFRKSFTGCFNKRRAMLATMIIWLLALTFGIALYSIFNWSILMG